MLMYLLSNQQRKCFALSPVETDWELTELMPSTYDLYSTYAYITPDNRVVKLIIEGDTEYREYDVREALSPDRTLILPKTGKGKPMKLTAANMAKRTPVGMALSFVRNYITLYSNQSDRGFYNSSYAGVTLNGISDFFSWIDRWCAETGEKELSDIEAFAGAPRCHVTYREGDFFRFRLDRHRFGYGRIILNYDACRKKKIPFWDVFAGKPLLAGIYRIVTEDELLSVDELDQLPMLPPQMIMDNPFYYGEYEIIGNRPVDESRVDFPVHYGRSIAMGDHRVMYQCGRTFRTREDGKLLYGGFSNKGIGWSFDIGLPVLLACIQDGSNRPYWEQPNQYRVREDLRNPIYAKELQEIRAEFDLN